MLKRGTVVISTAGRDKDYLLVIIRADEKTVTVCDGKERPLEKPKGKNIRHISPTRFTLTEEEMATNRALRRALRRVRDEIICNI